MTDRKSFKVRIDGGGPPMSVGVYEQLKNAIVSCVVMPGENLHEAELAERFDVSKTPVREALNLLRRDGFIISVARHGHQVSHMTVEDVREIYEMRLVVEPAVAAIAAGALTDDALKELRGLAGVRYVHGEPAGHEVYLTVNRRFHEVLAAASGNRRLMRLSRHLLDETERFFRLTLEAEDLAGELVEEREQLVDALARRDGTAAEQIVRSQIEQSRRRVLDAVAATQVPSSERPASVVRISFPGPGRGWDAGDPTD